MDFSLIIPAFIAGVLTFLAPCTLPLVPGYLGFISGASLEDLKNPKRAKTARWKIFLNGFFFMLGFSAVFIIMGTLVGFIAASLLAPYRLWLGRIGGVFVIIFGLFMLNALKIPFLTRERQLKAPALFERGKPTNSFILGSAFAFGFHVNQRASGRAFAYDLFSRTGNTVFIDCRRHWIGFQIYSKHF